MWNQVAIGLYVVAGCCWLYLTYRRGRRRGFRVGYRQGFNAGVDQYVSQFQNRRS